MPLISAKCTNCGANLEVDSSKDAAICPYCKAPYIVEKAINHYNTTNHIHADVVNMYGSANSDFVIQAGSLIKYNGASVDVTIPDGVVAIESAFENCIGLKSVTIPDGVTLIGDNAFRGCKNLTSVKLPNEVTKIGCAAFIGCSGLTSIVLPNNLTHIDSLAFSGCSGLTSVTIPNGVSSIGDFAFSGCANLKSVILPNGVTIIGARAFEGCTGLTSIALPDKLTQIGEWAFLGCSGLTSVTIPSGVTKIEEGAFAGCSGLTSVSIASSSLSWSVRSWSPAPFSSNSLKKIVFLPGVKTADLAIFFPCENVEIIVFPDSIEEIINWPQRHIGQVNYYLFNVKQILVSPEVEAKNKNTIKSLSGHRSGYETKKSHGCYIATAVYGSYDCPEVWTLRRFRDNELAKTWYGRAFIHSYYAISPTLVKWFGGTEWFKSIWKPKLDKMVDNLLKKGFENKPYHDLDW